MQGSPIDDDALAAAYAVCVAAPRARRISIAEAARRIGCARPTLSTRLNGDRDRIAEHHQQLIDRGRLDAAVQRAGLGGLGDDDDELDFDFALREPQRIDEQLVREAAAIVLNGFPPLWALVSAGADEYDAEEWLAEAQEAQERRAPGWPASGARLLARAAAHVGQRIFREALQARGSDSRLRLGQLIAPRIFKEPEQAAGSADPFADLTDAQLERLAFADFGDPDERAD